MHDVFYFTDIHGMYDLYKSIMDYCQEQDPEATIIYGGDAIDRGRDGYKIMNELLDNPKVIYLKGNHEDMFCKAARELKECFDFDLNTLTREEVRGKIYWCRSFDYRYAAIQDSLYNGGLDTLTDWVMDGIPMNLVERIERLPFTFSYGKCDFCHSAGLYKTFVQVADAEYSDEKVDPYAADYLIWGRTSLNMDWEPNRIAVFGHTPTPYLKDYTDFKFPEGAEITPVLYNKTGPGWKLDMDTGAVFTGKAYVLNVLTMKAQGFEDIEYENKEINRHDVKKIECIQF